MLARRPMLWLGGCFAGGVALARLTDHPDLAVKLALLLAVLGVLLAHLRHHASADESGPAPEIAQPFLPRPWRPLGLDLSLLLTTAGLFCIVLGAWRAGSVEAARQDALEALPTFFDADLLIEAQPDAQVLAAFYRSRSWTCPARLMAADGRVLGALPVQLRGRGVATFERGDRLHARVRLERNDPAAFPGDFDVRQYLAGQGRMLALATVDDQPLRVEPAQSFSLLRALDRWRAGMVRTILTRLPPREGALLAVVLFGYRAPYGHEAATEYLDLRGSFRDLGVGHLLAISGLHVGLVVGLAWLVSTPLLPDRRWRAAVCIGVCLIYLVLSGGRVAAVRAAVMAVVYLGGTVLGRRSDFANALGFAALLILASNPWALTDMGFLLSFVTVLFISRICQEIEQRLEQRRDARDEWRDDEPDRLQALRRIVILRVRQLLMMSTAAWLGVWPLSAYAFCQIHPGGLPANIVVLPLMSLVLAGGALVPGAAWLPGIVGDWSAMACAMPAHLLVDVVERAARIPGAALTVARPEIGPLLAYYAGFVLLFCRRMLPVNARRWGMGVAAGLVVAGSAALVWQMLPQQPTQASLTLLPARYGEAVVVRTGDGRVAVIGHLDRGGLDAGRYLRTLGVSAVDLVVLLGNTEPELDSLRSLLAVGEVTPWQRQQELDTPEPAVARLEELGIRLHVSRDRDGQLVWWSVRHDDLQVGVSEWCWRGQMQYRIRRGEEGIDAPLVSLRVRKKDEERTVADQLSAGLVLVGHNFEDLPPGLLERREVGAVELMKREGVLGVRGFDGAKWADLAPSSGAALVPEAVSQ